VRGSGQAVTDHERRSGVRRALLTGSGLALAVIALAGCGGSSKSSASDPTIQKEAAYYQIDQIEQTWHRAASHHDVNLMMTLWAPGAVFNVGGKTLSGKAQIRNFFKTENAAFMPQHHWESDTPSYKIRTTVHGDKGTLYFECHYVDVRTGKVEAVVGVDHNVQKINGKWLIVDSAGSIATLG
jgi:ketosteroid isomerase-like protein